MAILTDVQLLRMRRTKIVATLGPASADEDTIEALIAAGVDVFRLNMSHGSHEDHTRSLRRVRQLAGDAGRPVAVLADLSGPKIRVGRFQPGGITLTAGESVRVTTRDVPGEPGLIPSQYRGITKDVRKGVRILLADGVMELEVISVDGTEIECKVTQGGQLTDRKGINLPDVDVSAPSLTEKDRADASFILDQGIDFLALSFVRSGRDMRELRTLMSAHQRQAALVAKIERPEALADINGILAESDAVMIARGDLGVELPPEQVPSIQQQLLDRARQFNRPAIVATQMLESMISNSRPTRAEVTDVSHSVASGADAVMLSAETAAGRHPVAAVEMMDRIARQAEAHLWREEAFGSLTLENHPGADTGGGNFGAAVARATSLLSRDLQVRAVVVFSESGMSAGTMTAARPAAPIVAISSNNETVRRMALNWGAIPVLVRPDHLEDGHELARRTVSRLGLATDGEYILIVQGFHAEAERNTPSVTLIVV